MPLKRKQIKVAEKLSTVFNLCNAIHGSKKPGESKKKLLTPESGNS